MEPITEKTMDNLAKRFHASLVVVFDADRNTAPYSKSFDLMSEPETHIAVIVYSRARAKQFNQACDARIGTHQSRYRYWPPSKGPVILPTIPPPNDLDQTINGFIFGALRLKIVCGYQFRTVKDPASSRRFYTAEMESAPSYYYTVVSSPDSIQVMELFFELTGYLEADYHSAEYEHHAKQLLKQCVPVEVDSEHWYEDKSCHTKFTCFDNPFGPFTNYTIIP